MQKSRVSAINITKVKVDQSNTLPDLVATEEPLEIRLGFGELENRQEKRIAVIMRTPENDFELALGFLFTEGVLTTHNDVLSIKYCTDRGKIEEEGNVIRVELKSTATFEESKLDRNFYMNSSCGVCGKASIESLESICPFPYIAPTEKLAKNIVFNLPNQLRSQQAVFEHTGGLHAVGLFDLQGELLLLREDVGRHNALDKLAGWALEQDLFPLQNKVLVLSGRASFELIQKAYMAGIQFVVAIGAPASLAVKTAEKFNIGLVGFTKEQSFNIYTNPEYIL